MLNYNFLKVKSWLSCRRCEAGHQRNKNIKDWIGIEDKPDIIRMQTQTYIFIFLYVYIEIYAIDSYWYMSLFVCKIYIYCPPNPPYIWKPSAAIQGEGRRSALCQWLVCSVLLLIRVIMDKIIDGDFVSHVSFEKKHECDCSFKVRRWVILNYFLKGKNHDFHANMKWTHVKDLIQLIN